MKIQTLIKIVGFLALFLLFTLVQVSAQSGGQFTLMKSVIGPGGGESAGGAFSIVGTVGQPTVGENLQNITFDLFNGFWTPEFAPTSATVSVSGRVLTMPNELGIANAMVIVTDAGGNSRSAITNSFGYYRFDGVTVGETYIFEVRAKGYLFSPQVIHIVEEINGLNFVGSK